MTSTGQTTIIPKRFKVLENVLQINNYNEIYTSRATKTSGIMNRYNLLPKIHENIEETTNLLISHQISENSKAEKYAEQFRAHWATHR
jgi:adenylate kinase